MTSTMETVFDVPADRQADRRLTFCIPVFDDWACAAKLLRQIDEVVGRQGWKATVLLIDDASTQPPPEQFETSAVAAVEVLRLRRNLGHQRAIAVGLSYLCVERPARAVVVMDGDGEDSPADVPQLMARFEAHGGRRVVFAARSKRSEGLGFRVGYRVFRIVHRILTGRGVEVGNFSVIPIELLNRLVGVSELWNHYAAACFKAKLPHDQVPIARAKRIDGPSKMNFVGLVSHGLSAMSVFGEEIGARLLAASSALVTLAVLGLMVVVGIRSLTPLAIAGWATTAAGVLVLIALNGLMLSIVFSFLVLHGRAGASFLPLRDYRYYILTSQRVPSHA